MRKGRRQSIKEKLQTLETGFSLAGDGDVDWNEVERVDNCLACSGFSSGRRKKRG